MCDAASSILDTRYSAGLGSCFVFSPENSDAYSVGCTSASRTRERAQNVCVSRNDVCAANGERRTTNNERGQGEPSRGETTRFGRKALLTKPARNRGPVTLQGSIDAEKIRRRDDGDIR